MSDAHHPVRRILERVDALPGVRPVRCFPLLLPFWAIEISATIRESQPYEIFDQYLEKAIGEAQLGDGLSLAEFFGVERGLVERGLRFLETIGHVQRAGERLRLTELGYESLRDGCRYVVKEDRQRLYFDGFHSMPLPRTHYRSTVWRNEPALRLADRTEFQVINSLAEFRMAALDELLARPDREAFNVPRELTAAQARHVGKVWLPVYAVETTAEPLVFTRAVDSADDHLSGRLNLVLKGVFEAENRGDPLDAARRYLDTRGFSDVTPRAGANGVLRAALPRDVFPSQVAWYRLGSFEMTRDYFFIQLWCTDKSLRRRAVLERACNMVRRGAVHDSKEVQEQLEQLGAQLEVPAPTMTDLRRHAADQDDEITLARLSSMYTDHESEIATADPWHHFARTHVCQQIVAGKVIELMPSGALVRLDDGVNGLIATAELAADRVDGPGRVVRVGDEVIVKLIDIDLELQRISLSLKQPNEEFVEGEEHFDPTLYGMPAEYDEQGNYIYPEGFDPETADWLTGFEAQRETWERQYMKAREVWEAHGRQARAARFTPRAGNPSTSSG
jgi:predicted RNA-binding protein with RPS1 domain